MASIGERFKKNNKWCTIIRKYTGANGLVLVIQVEGRRFQETINYKHAKPYIEATRKEVKEHETSNEDICKTTRK